MTLNSECQIGDYNTEDAALLAGTLSGNLRTEHGKVLATAGESPQVPSLLGSDEISAESELRQPVRSAASDVETAARRGTALGSVPFATVPSSTYCQY